MRSLALVLVLAATSGAHAQVYKPFTKVDDACPRCSGGPAYDRIALRGGDELRAVVIAENEAFYVLLRFGELRAVGRDQVASVTKNDAAVRPPGFGDQILLVDGTVRAGTMDADPAPDAAFFDLKVPETQVHHVARVAVAAVYRGGKRVYAATAAPAK
jgi:hypothetical protein